MCRVVFIVALLTLSAPVQAGVIGMMTKIEQIEKKIQEIDEKLDELLRRIEESK